MASDGKEISRIRPGLKQEVAASNAASSTGQTRTRRSSHGIPGNGESEVEKRPRRTFSSKTPNTDFACSSRQEGQLIRKDLGLHKVVFNDDVLADGTALAYYACGQICMSGLKRGFRILCFCCKSEVIPSKFEVHAGFASRRQPYPNIYTSNGASLHELAFKLSQLQLRKLTDGKSDDLCSICATQGDLLCCASCPRAFHTGCVSLPCLPTGTWHCKYCQRMAERRNSFETNANAKAAGRIVGTDHGGCVLCRGHDFSTSEFGPRTIIICYQCEKQYHVRCLKEYGMDDLKELPMGKWFCCKDCSMIHSALKERVAIKDDFLPESFLLNIVETRDRYFSWRLLGGRSASDEDCKLLSNVVSIFHKKSGRLRFRRNVLCHIESQFNHCISWNHPDFREGIGRTSFGCYYYRKTRTGLFQNAFFLLGKSACVS